MAALIAQHDVFFVGIHCPLELLVEREAKRGDRPIGSARQDYETIHIGKAYDIELNTRDDLDANVEALLAAWRSGGGASSFRRDRT